MSVHQTRAAGIVAGLTMLMSGLVLAAWQAPAASAEGFKINSEARIAGGVLTVDAGEGLLGEGSDNNFFVQRLREYICPTPGGGTIDPADIDHADRCEPTGNFKLGVKDYHAHPLKAIGGGCRQGRIYHWKPPQEVPVTDGFVIDEVRESRDAVMCDASLIAQIHIRAGGGRDGVRFWDHSNAGAQHKIVATPAIVEGGPGNDRLFGTAASGDTIAGGPGADTIGGSIGDDIVDGGPDGDVLLAAGPQEDHTTFGDPGADTLLGGEGCIEQCGGDGDPQDAVDYSQSPSQTCVKYDGEPNDGAWDGRRSIEHDNVFDDVESIRAGRGGLACAEWPEDARPEDRDIDGSDKDDTATDPPGPTDIDLGEGEDTLYTTTTTTTFPPTSTTIYVTDDDPGPADDPDEPEIPDGPDGQPIPPTTTSTTVPPPPQWGRPRSAWAPISGGPDDWLDGRGDQYTDVEIVHGTPGRDRVYFATDGKDETYYTGGGNDTVLTRGGNDKIVGEGTGSSTVHAGSGNDTVEGNGAIANINGGSGSDNLYAESAAVSPGGHAAAAGAVEPAAAGSISIFGGLGNDKDKLFGWPGRDTLNGGGGDDTLFGRGGPDVLIGGDSFGPGIDTASYGTYPYGVRMSIGDGANDGANCPGPSCEGADVRGDIENIAGGKQGDTLIGNAGANELDGNAGDDTLDGGPGPDHLIGNGGHDTVSYATATSPVKVTANDGLANDGQHNGAEGDNMTSGVEEIHGGPFGDDITGSKRANLLRGNGGNDTLNGTRGKDTLYGDAGQDTLLGKKGRDTLEGGPDHDVLQGDQGKDVLKGDGGPDELIGGGGRDSIFGGSDGDTLRGEGGGDNLYGEAGDDDIFGGDGKDHLFGGPDNDNLFGEAGGDKLDGEAGNDQIEGGTGKDKLYARDGERDELRCGKPKRDRAEADTSDYIAWAENPDFGSASLPADEACEKVSIDAVAPAVAPAPDYVATASVDFGVGGLSLHVDGRTGERNQINVTSDESYVTVWDNSGVVQPGTGCSYVFLGVVGCAKSGFHRVEVRAGDRNDTVYMGATGSLYAPIVNGGQGNDVLIAADGTRTQLKGDDGTDVMIPGYGTKDMDGGDGDYDTVWYLRSHAIVADNDGVADDGSPFFGGERGNVRPSVEVIAGGSGPDTLTARQDVAAPADPNDDSGVETVLIGGGGNDRLTGGATDDLLVDAEFGEGSGNDVLYGGGGTDTLEGGDGADTLNGGPGPDELDGSSGNDSLTGGGGADTLEGGGGADGLSGGNEPDELDGGSGNDTLDGGSGDDALEGGGGADNLQGGDGDDELGGGDGNDMLDGGYGADDLAGEAGWDAASYLSHTTGTVSSLDGEANDGSPGESDMLGWGIEALVGTPYDDDMSGSEKPELFIGLQGHDKIDGGDGNDVIFGDFLADDSGDADILSGGAGSDHIRGQGGDDQLDGGADEDELFGGSGADTLAGGLGVDALSGGDDGDVLQGGEGPDEIDPGSGQHDLLDYSDQQSRMKSDLTDLAAGATKMGDGDLVEPGIDDLRGGAGPDQLYGDASANVIDGNGGSDRIDGDAGGDTITGGAGIDTIEGGAGDDQLDALDGIDDGKLMCGPGDDTVVADPTPYEPGYACEHDDRMSPGGRVEIQNGTLTYEARRGEANQVTVSRSADSIVLEDLSVELTPLGSCAAIDSNRVGCPASEVQGAHIALDDLDDSISLNADLPVAIDAGAGDDVIQPGPSDDQLDGGTGSDTVSYAERTEPLSASLVDGTAGQNGELDRLFDVENIDGGAGPDTLLGNQADNRLDGGDGDDVIRGREGNDELLGGRGRGFLYGDDGQDVLAGGVDDDLLDGGPGDDVLQSPDGSNTFDGGTGDDTSYGGDGLDTIVGGDGADELYGGDGNDWLYGSDGDDALSGDAGTDGLYGEGGSDRLLARDEQLDLLICSFDGVDDGVVNYFDKDPIDVFGPAPHGCSVEL